jgi:hypothetical protein
VKRFLLLLMVLVGLWVSGTLDHALYPLRLNFHTCLVAEPEGHRHVLCGSELQSIEIALGRGDAGEVDERAR